MRIRILLKTPTDDEIGGPANGLVYMINGRAAKKVVLQFAEEAIVTNKVVYDWYDVPVVFDDD